MNENIRIHISINKSDSTDPEELYSLAFKLRKELLETDVETIESTHSGKIPEKAKAWEPMTLNTLLVTLAASGGVLTTVINTIQSWLNRQGDRSITLEIDGDKLEIKGISSEEQQRLINLWIKRHTKA